MGTPASNQSPRMSFTTPPKVTPVVAEAVDVYRRALRAMRKANESLVRAKRSLDQRHFEAAQCAAADARTVLTNARCDFEAVLVDE